MWSVATTLDSEGINILLSLALLGTPSPDPPLPPQPLLLSVPLLLPFPAPHMLLAPRISPLTILFSPYTLSLINLTYSIHWRMVPKVISLRTASWLSFQLLQPTHRCPNSKMPKLNSSSFLINYFPSQLMVPPSSQMSKQKTGVHLTCSSSFIP